MMAEQGTDILIQQDVIRSHFIVIFLLVQLVGLFFIRFRTVVYEFTLGLLSLWFFWFLDTQTVWGMFASYREGLGSNQILIDYSHKLCAIIALKCLTSKTAMRACRVYSCFKDANT